jgi:cellulose biosynthesis protein BcsQ
METIKLAIFTKDTDYGIELGEALSIFRNNFIVKVFKDEKELDALCDLGATGELDLLLLELDDSKKRKAFAKDKRVVKLTEVREDCTKNIESKDFVIYKFSTVQDIAANLLLYYSLLCGKKSFSPPNENVKMIAFCSAKGGTGKTTVALGIGQALRRYYSKSVLYLNFEEVESTLRYMKERDDGLDLCAYLYYLFKPDGEKPDAEAFMISDKFGVKAFMPGTGANELLKLDDEKMSLFLDEAGNSGDVDYILLDMGESLSDRAKSVLSICSKLIIVSQFDIEEDAQEKRYARCLQGVSGATNDLTENIIHVYNKITDLEEVAFDGTGIYIELDEDSFKRHDGVIEISIDRDFGRGIKELVKKII